MAFMVPLLGLLVNYKITASPCAEECSEDRHQSGVRMQRL